MNLQNISSIDFEQLTLCDLKSLVRSIRENWEEYCDLRVKRDALIAYLERYKQHLIDQAVREERKLVKAEESTETLKDSINWLTAEAEMEQLFRHNPDDVSHLTEFLSAKFIKRNWLKPENYTECYSIANLLFWLCRDNAEILQDKLSKKYAEAPKEARMAAVIMGLHPVAADFCFYQPNSNRFSAGIVGKAIFGDTFVKFRTQILATQIECKYAFDETMKEAAREVKESLIERCKKVAHKVQMQNRIKDIGLYEQMEAAWHAIPDYQEFEEVIKDEDIAMEMFTELMMDESTHQRYVEVCKQVQKVEEEFARLALEKLQAA